MIRIQEILDKVAANNNDADLELIQKAYVFAATAHAGQTRLSGEPYLSHPLAVADTLAEMGFDEPTVVAGLLHDTVEDTKATLEEIEENFGEEVADIVDGVTKISKISFENKEEAQAENIRKMILAMSHDMRVLMVKLADRLHNMRTLDFQKAYKQKRSPRRPWIFTPRWPTGGPVYHEAQSGGSELQIPAAGHLQPDRPLAGQTPGGGKADY